MAGPVLQIPFRLLPNGQLATVEQDSDDGDAQAIAVLIYTRQGERELWPTFGIPDPVFGTLSAAAIKAGVATYGPPVVIDSVDITYPDVKTLNATVSFH